MTENLELNIGHLAPGFKLPATTGSDISLADYRDHKNVYLFFIREYN